VQANIFKATLAFCFHIQFKKLYITPVHFLITIIAALVKLLSWLPDLVKINIAVLFSFSISF